MTRDEFLAQYPTLHSCVLDIAYDNGYFNSQSRTEQALFKKVLTLSSEHNFVLAETQLSDLDEDELEQLCCGEENEVLAGIAPAGNTLLSAIFNVM